MGLDFEKLKANDPKVKYGFTKELLAIAKQTPEKLMEHYEKILTMLDSENNIIKWTAIDLIGYLSAVDDDCKVEKQLPVLKRLLHGGQLITSNHAIFALELIAKNKPNHKAMILKELLKIPNDQFDTAECNNIATGKVLETFTRLLPMIEDQKVIRSFAEKALSNEGNATRKKAEKLMRKIEKKNKSLA